MDNNNKNENIKNKKNGLFLSLVDKRIRAIIAVLVIVLGFAFFGSLLILNIPDLKREIIVFILGNVTAYVNLILAFFFGSSEDRDRNDRNHSLNSLSKNE